MIDHKFYPDRNYATITIEGHNTLEEFKDATVSFREDDRFHDALHRICDFTKADLSQLSTLDLLKYAAFSRTMPVAKSSRLALVGTGNNTLLMMFANAMSNYEIKTLPTIEDAIKWVGTAEHSNTSQLADLSTKLKIHTASGELTAQKALEMQQDWFDSGNYDPTMPVLWDIRNADIASSLPIAKQGASQMFERRNTQQHSARVAILIGKKGHEIMMRHIFQAGISSGRTRIFNSEPDAIQWLMENNV